MDDLDLIQRCVSGDKSAWEELVVRYSNLIYSFIHRVLKIKGSPIGPDTVTELFQEIFILLSSNNFKKLKSFQGKNGCTLASWLRQVTVNFTIDYTRKAKTMLSLDDDCNEDLNFKDNLASDSPTVADMFEQAENFAELKDCIERLNNDDKYFLELYIYRGFKLKELKDILALSRQAVDMRKARLMGRLRECFRSKGFVLDF